MPTVIDSLKICAKCKASKPIVDFTRDASSRDGRCSYCRLCKSGIEKRWRLDHSETVRARKRDERRRNAETYRRGNVARYGLNRGQESEKSKAYYAEHAEAAKARAEIWRKANPEKYSAMSKKSYRRHQRKRLIAAKVHRMKYPERWNAKTAARRARKTKATPKWANSTLTQAFYKLAVEIAAETGVPHHVDHIVPLVSDIVCGLHWHGNLQVIPSSINHEKSNAFIAGEPIQVIGDAPCLR